MIGPKGTSLFSYYLPILDTLSLDSIDYDEAKSQLDKLDSFAFKLERISTQYDNHQNSTLGEVELVAPQVSIAQDTEWRYVEPRLTPYCR